MRCKDTQNSVAKYEGETATYLINGYTYRIIRIHMEAGMLRGYCPKKRKAVWLTDKFVQFEGEPAVAATKILGEK